LRRKGTQQLFPEAKAPQQTEEERKRGLEAEAGQRANEAHPRVSPVPIFVSYRALDNQLPPERRGHGFVDYLLAQLRYELDQLGMRNKILWLDRKEIFPGDVWSADLLDALNRAELFIAIVSPNYISSSWCEKELDVMKSRAEMLGAPAEARRIFRVDKHKVPETHIPKTLQSIQAVRFYRQDHDAVDEFFWGGKVRLSREYHKALLQLASAIHRRVEELRTPTPSL
jgi:hypothetical protein